MSDTKLFRLSGSATAVDLRTGHNATLRPGLVVLSEDAHTHAMAAPEAERDALRAELQHCKTLEAGALEFRAELCADNARLRAALKLARNRLQRLALDVPGTMGQEVMDWAIEADAALAGSGEGE